MIIKSINFDEFLDSFSDTYKNNFTYEGKRALFDFLDDEAECSDTPYELDTIALCCDYTEYDNLADLQASYPDIKSMEDLQNHTMVLPITKLDGNKDAFIIQNY
jgi:hypothetical protein